MYLAGKRRLLALPDALLQHTGEPLGKGTRIGRTVALEHACFVEDHAAFEGSGAQVLGVSVDSKWAHAAYADKMKIKYPLLADFQPRGAVGDKFGVYLADKGITGRAIAIVDRSGNIAWFKNYDIPVVPDLKEVADALAKVK